MTELEQLRADLEVLEKYNGYSIMENALCDVRDRIAALEAAADPWREAKQVQAWLRDAINRQVVFAGATQISEYLDHLTDENARLEKRVAELEADIADWKKAANHRNILANHCLVKPCDLQAALEVELAWRYEVKARVAELEDVKDVADMQPPFEGPIVGIEPVLDPARVLATARKWFMDTDFGRHNRETIAEVIRILGIQLGSRNAKPYKLKEADK